MITDFRVVALDRARIEQRLEQAWSEDSPGSVVVEIADANPGFPCRVSLEDAPVGERVFLLNYGHHLSISPYRASGPIYVREAATTARPDVNEVPPFLRGRTLSVRAYDNKGMMRLAEVRAGADLGSCIQALFRKTEIDYLHIHNAGPGCYMCEVIREMADGASR